MRLDDEAGSAFLAAGIPGQIWEVLGSGRSSWCDDVVALKNDPVRSKGWRRGYTTAAGLAQHARCKLLVTTLP